MNPIYFNNKTVTGNELFIKTNYLTYFIVKESCVSQADADSQAQSDVDNNKQDYANSNGGCSCSGYYVTSAAITNCSGSQKVTSIQARLDYHVVGCESNAPQKTLNWKLTYQGNSNVITSGSKVIKGDGSIDLGTIDTNGEKTCASLHISTDVTDNVWSC